MKSSAFLFSVLLMLASCTNTSHNGSEPSATNNIATNNNQNSQATPILSGCYLHVLKRDTLALNLQQTGNTVSGKLSFDNFEKDGSSGPVTGTIDKDTVKLIYSFQSEGMHSVMEVYFKIVDNALIHGIGEVATKSDTTYYADPAHLNYPENQKLLKVSCEQLDQKYK